MNYNRFVKVLLLTAASAALVAPSLCPEIDGLLTRPLPPQVAVVSGEVHEQAGSETSLVHGAVQGVPASLGSGLGEMPGGVNLSPASPLDQEYRDLVIAVRRASRSGSEGYTIWQSITAFLTRSDPTPGDVWQQSVVDQKYGMLPWNSDFLDKLEQRAALRGGDNSGADRFAVIREAFEARMLAILSESAAARPASGSDSCLVPIYVPTDAIDSLPGVPSDFTARAGTTSGVSPADGPAPSVVPPPGGSGVALVPAGSNAWNGGSSNGSLATAVSPSPPPSPLWPIFAPTPVSMSRHAVATIHSSGRSSSVAPTPVSMSRDAVTTLHSFSNGSIVATPPAMQVPQFLNPSIAPSASITLAQQTSTARGEIGGTSYVGQSVTTPAGGPFDDLVFNFFNTSNSADAVGTLFLLSQSYSGSPSGLSSNAAGYIAQATASGGFFTFSSSVTIASGTQYFFYNNANDGSVAYANDNYAGGILYNIANSTQNYVSFTTYDTAFQLTGMTTGIPEPSSLTLLGLAAIGVLIRRARRR